MNSPIQQIIDISVIIVTYNHRQVIGETLQTLKNSKNIEVIVIDNASIDGSADYIKQNFQEVKLIANHENIGFGSGCNQGAKLSVGEYLFFLNPDATATVKQIEVMVDFLKTKSNAAAVGPKIFCKGEVEYSCRPFPGYKQVLFHRYSILTKLFPNNPISSEYLMSNWKHDTPKTVDWISGSAMAIPRKKFFDVGGFDERYFLFCEDTDLCKQFSQKKWEVWYLPTASVNHKIGESRAASSLNTLYQRHRSIWIYYRKFNSGFFLIDFITWLGIAARFLLYLILYYFQRLLPK